MDKTEKTILGISLVTLLIFIFSIIYLSKGLGVEVPECIPAEQPFDEGGVDTLSKHDYTLKYVARMWTFDPETVRIPEGSKVEIYLAAADVVHGLWVSEKNINLMAVPGAVNKTSVTFNEPGVYDVICHEYCGTGHQNMMGKIIVEETQEKQLTHASQ